MLIALDAGHGVKPDIGASGNGFLEDKLTQKVVEKVAEILKKNNHSVIFCRPSSATSVNNSLYQRCKIANKANAQLFVSIHFNAFNGQANGSEVFAISSIGKQYARRILSEIVELGFVNRGVKNTAFFVLKNTVMPAVLVECCFIDSQKDMNLFNVDEMALAIAQGITNQSITEKESIKPLGNWQDFINTLKDAEIPAPKLRDIIARQAALESGKGTSKLFKEHFNPWSIKYRHELESVAESVEYNAHDGQDSYAKFANFEDAIKGYWLFIGRSVYNGWETFKHHPQGYIQFIKDCGYAEDPDYVKKVLSQKNIFD